MRVGLLINTIDTNGGIQKNYRILHDLFQSYGHTSTLYVLHKPELTKVDDSSLVFLKGRTRWLKGRYLRKLLEQEEHFDLFLVNAEYMRNYLPFDHYYITVHNTWSSKMPAGLKGWWKKRRIYRKYAHQNLIGISDGVLDDIEHVLKIPIMSRRTIYAPHNEALVKVQAQEEVDVPDQYIVAVGSLIERKNYALLIDAFAKVLKQHNIALLIVGAGSNKTALESQLIERELQGMVHLVGFQENPYPYIKRARLLVLSSNSEGLPRSVVEALLLNVPVVTTQASEGVFEIMTGDFVDYVVPVNDVDALAEAINQALNSYPKIAPQTLAKFQLPHVYQQYCALAIKKQAK